MSFDADWLALREPEDHRARSARLARDCANHFSDMDALRIVDIGCGAGSNLRALAPLLAREQHWRLVDYDPGLLDAARARLSAWADEAAREDGGLRLVKGDRVLHVAFERRDLARDIEPLFEAAPDLVTASALFDLVSRDWIARFCGALALRRLPLLAALTYDGREEWSPAHPADAAILAAFHAHQGRDKGFGPAAGPRATEALAAALRACAYTVTIEKSDWILPEGAALTKVAAEGVAQAVRETGRVAEIDIDAWLAARTGARARIGHDDLFAVPA